jgi:hypothetical protein
VLRARILVQHEPWGLSWPQDPCLLERCKPQTQTQTQPVGKDSELQKIRSSIKNFKEFFFVEGHLQRLLLESSTFCSAQNMSENSRGELQQATTIYRRQSSVTVSDALKSTALLG